MFNELTRKEKESAYRRKRYASDPERRRKAQLAAKSRYTKNPEKLKQEMRARYRKNCAIDGFKEGIRKRKLKERYGLTQEKWDSLFESQGRCCAVCKMTETENKHK